MQTKFDTVQTTIYPDFHSPRMDSLFKQACFAIGKQINAREAFVLYADKVLESDPRVLRRDEFEEGIEPVSPQLPVPDREYVSGFCFGSCYWICTVHGEKRSKFPFQDLRLFEFELDRVVLFDRVGILVYITPRLLELDPGIPSGPIEFDPAGLCGNHTFQDSILVMQGKPHTGEFGPLERFQLEKSQP